MNDTSRSTILNLTNLNASRMNATLGVIKLKNALGLEEDEKQWNNLFTLRISMLPSQGYISSTMAEKILFIGKAVRVL